MARVTLTLVALVAVGACVIVILLSRSGEHGDAVDLVESTEEPADAPPVPRRNETERPAPLPEPEPTPSARYRRTVHVTMEGAPASGATVVLHPAVRAPYPEVNGLAIDPGVPALERHEADADGRLDLAFENDHPVYAVARLGSMMAGALLTPAADDAATALELTLVETVPRTIIVRGPGGEPIPGGLVRLDLTWNARTRLGVMVWTGDEGGVVVNLPTAARFRGTASLVTFGPAGGARAPLPSTRSHETVVLEATSYSHVDLVVVDERDDPFPHPVEVTWTVRGKFARDHGGAGVRHVVGSFSMAVFQPTTVAGVVGSHPEYERAEKVEALPASIGQRRTITLRMKEALTWVGFRLVDVAGDPVRSGVSVRTRQGDESRWARLHARSDGWRVAVESGAAGSLEIFARTARMMARQLGRDLADDDPTRVPFPSLAPRTEHDAGDVVLEPPPLLAAGRILEDGGGRVPPRLRVNLIARDPDSARDSVVLWATANEHGLFEIHAPELSGVDWRAELASQNGAWITEPVPFVAGDADVVLRFGRSASVSGRIRFAHPEWSRWVQARLHRIGGETKKVIVVSGGSFRARRLRPGRYSFEATAGTEVVARISEFVLPSGEDARPPALGNVRLDVIDGAVQVFGADGEPLPKARVTWKASDGGGRLVFHAPTGEDGTVSAPLPRHRRFDVTVTGPGRRKRELVNPGFPLRVDL